MSEFHRTVMGRHLFGVTLPGLVTELGRIGEQLGEIQRMLARVAERRSTPRRRVLLVHHDVPHLQALGRVLRDQHEVCIARTHDVARELIELHEFDTILIDDATAWERLGSSLFEQARVVRPEALCVVLTAASSRERDALERRRGVDVALSDARLPELIRELRVLLGAR